MEQQHISGVSLQDLVVTSYRGSWQGSGGDELQPPLQAGP